MCVHISHVCCSWTLFNSLFLSCYVSFIMISTIITVTMITLQKRAVHLPFTELIDRATVRQHCRYSFKHKIVGRLVITAHLIDPRFFSYQYGCICIAYMNQHSTECKLQILRVINPEYAIQQHANQWSRSTSPFHIT